MQICRFQIFYAICFVGSPSKVVATSRYCRRFLGYCIASPTAPVARTIVKGLVRLEGDTAARLPTEATIYMICGCILDATIESVLQS